MLHAVRCKYGTQKKSPKIAIWAPSHKLSGYIFAICPAHNMVNFDPLAAEIGSGVWRTPANLNWFRVLAELLHGTLVLGVSQTAALNRGRHLCSAGRPSGWALAHILVIYTLFREERIQSYILYILHNL